MKFFQPLFFLSFLFFVNINSSFSQNNKIEYKEIIPGAYRMDMYLPLLKDKKVALLINQTSRIGNELLLDTLMKRKVNIVKIFVPEHGFRGMADAGAHVKNDVDEKSGLPIISLYGNNKQPTNSQLADVDIVIYDLQDVGTRFYTYISSLEYLMDACIENKKQLIILDRPNPNGFYVDGPVLDKSLKSFVGMQAIPIVYGMTAGEYAKMLVGENWISNAAQLNLKIITCKNYNHSSKYNLQVAPSPNLKTMAAIYLYPSLCFFEGTVISVGRGTNMPFQQWGNPLFGKKSKYFFIPKTTTGASNPLYEGEKCYGELLATTSPKSLQLINNKINLSWLLQAYNEYPEKEKFFNSFFEKLAGTHQLRKQIEEGTTEKEIRASWQNDLIAFKKIRKKYLLYKDFE